MALNTQEQILIEQRVANDGKTVLVAYLFWFFLGIVAAHRFYLGRPGTALLQIASYLILVGFIWLLIDAFLIPGMVRQANNELRDRLSERFLAVGAV